MKTILSLIILLAATFYVSGQSSSSTYTDGDIPTMLSYSGDEPSSCPGVLTVTIPANATITGVDVVYSMTAQSGAYMSEQLSKLVCTFPGGTSEANYFEGNGEMEGTQDYARYGLAIADEVEGGGEISFELHALRTYGGSDCNKDYNRVDDNSWTVTVHYGIYNAARPQSFTATATGISNILLEWIKNVDNDNVMIAYNTLNEFGIPVDGTSYVLNQTLPGGGTIIYKGGDDNFDHGSLNPNQLYYYRIWSYNTENEYSGGRTRSAITFCAAFNTPLFEDFDDVPEYSLPECWQSIADSEQGHYVKVRPNPLHGWDDNQMVVFWNNYGDSPLLVLVTPELQQPLNTLSVNFDTWYPGRGFSWASFEIGVMSDPQDFSTYESLETYIYEYFNEDWVSHTFYFNNYSGTANHIAFKANIPEWQGFFMCLDNLLIDGLPSCLEPTNADVSNITINSAQISWDAGQDETLWDLKYGPQGFDPLTEGTIIFDIVTANYTLTGLDHSTGYDVYVRAVCEVNDLSAWSAPVSFMTLCDLVNVPIAESFDGSSWEMPICWTVVNDSFIAFASLTSDFYYSPPHSLYMQGNSSSATGVMLISPGIIENINTLMLSFYSRTSSTNLPLLVGTVSDPTDPTTFTQFQSVTVPANWGLTEISFAAYTGSDQYIAFKLAATGSLFLDDILITIPESCPKPTDFSVSNITTNSAQFQWTAGSSETTWQLLYGAPGFDPLTQGTLVEDITNNPYTLTGLTPASGYDCYLRADCGTRDLSQWVGPVEFNTECLPFTLPYFEGFEDNTPPDLPICMTSLDLNEYDAWQTSQVSPASGFFSARIGSSLAPIKNDWLFTPGLQLTAGETYLVRFKYKASNAGRSEAMALHWGYAPTPDAMVGKQIFNNLSFTHTTYQNVELTFTPTITGIHYFGWHAKSANLKEYIYLDDIEILEMPICYYIPTPLNPINIAATSALLRWTPGFDETMWQVKYGPFGFDPETEGTIVPDIITENNFLLEGLQADTFYDFYVRALCGGPHTSEWSVVGGFRTLPGNLLFVNGLLVTSYRRGLNNNDISVYATNQGYDVSVSSDNRIADDFMLEEGSWWKIEKFRLNAFQRYSGTISKFTHVNIRIWDGMPGEESSQVIWGNDVSNVYMDSEFKRCYRVHESNILANDKPVMEIIADVSTHDLYLEGGTYWIDFQLHGSGSYPPMQPIFTSGSPYPYNARWFNKASDDWIVAGAAIPLLVIGSQATPSILPPGNFDAEALSDSQIDLSWLLNAGSDDILLAYSAENVFGTPLNGTTYSPGQMLSGGGSVLAAGNQTGFSHLGLDPGTMYFYKIWSKNASGDYSFGRTSSAKTQCGLHNLPYEEDFSGIRFPDCWSQTYSGVLTSPLWEFSYSVWSGATANELRASSTSQSGYGLSRLISPAINTNDLDEVTLTFTTAYWDYEPGITFKIQTSSDLVNFTDELWSHNSGSGDILPGTVVNIPITNNLGGMLYIAWVGQGDHVYFYDWFIDNVIITGSGGVPVHLPVAGVTLGSGQENCYNASQSIAVQNFTVQSGGQATFIAGTGGSIVFLPETRVHHDGYLHAYITLDETYCTNPSSILISDSEPGEAEIPAIASDNSGEEPVYYPNPTHGIFTIDLSMFKAEDDVLIEVFNMHGEAVYRAQIQGFGLSEINLSGKQPGLYIIRLVSGKKVMTGKILKL